MALFSPFRALGYITDSECPFAINRRGKETYVTVSVGKAWQIYNTNKLGLVLVGPQFKHTITALACKGDLTFAAVKGSIIECKRVHRTGEYRGGHSDYIVQLFVLADYLLALGKDGKLLIWRIGDYESPESSIQLEDGFIPTCMAHPDTYLNKIVVGSEDGRIQLWNFMSCEMLYEFKSFGGSAIRCIEPSPALDVVGIGLADGRAIIHNLRFDEQVMELANASGVQTNADMYLSNTAAKASRMAAGSACTTLAFKTGPGVPLLAAGGAAGVITVWNLEQRRLDAVLRDAHDGPLISLHFFAGEPVLMSSSSDNSVKQWIFDGSDGAGRLLRFRSGHSAPPTIVRYYADGKRLLSAGQDRAFRLFSTIQDAQSRELSQRHIAQRAKRLKVDQQELKLARVIGLDTCDVRERDWSNVITAHEGDSNAYVWRLQKYALGEHVLGLPPKETLPGCPPAAPVTAVVLSRCGNFGFVGSSNGRVDRYNMQSGLHRGGYKRGGPACNQGIGATAHTGTVTGIATDSCNRLLTTAGLDGWLRVWNFKTRELVGEVSAGSAISKTAHHSGTGLVAAACDDLVVRIFDIEARRIVRRFKGHTDRVTDIQLSEDCRWLLSSSMDNTLRVWDIPGSQVLQVLRLGSPVTSLSLSPLMDLLSTTHVERNGVYLWANQLLFGSGADIIPSEKCIDARLPSVSTGRRHRSRKAAITDGKEGRKRSAAHHGITIAGQQSIGGDAKDDVSDDSMDDEDSGSDLEIESSLDSFGSEEDQDDDDDDGTTEPSDSLIVEIDDVWAATNPSTGAPVPIIPKLVTLSMLPKTQWQNLVHLDVIKERNKPIEPPKKPEAAPFFLPTVAGANSGRNPVFDLDPDAENPFGDESDEEDKATDDDEDADNNKSSRVLHSLQAGGGNDGRNTLVKLLHASSDAGDWTSLIGYLRSLQPSQIDTELREMQILEGDPPEMEVDILLLLNFLEAETSSNANFDFVQALLRATLAIHGDAIATRPVLAAAAARIEKRIASTWGRLDTLLNSVRCMVGLLGNLQGS